MGSSTRPEPWIPDLPDNEPAIMDTLRQYQAALRSLSIPELLAQSVRIAEAQQRLGSSSLHSMLDPGARITTYLEAVDRATPRSRPTAPLSGSERGRASAAFRSQPPSPSPAPSRSGVLGYDAARRIAATQVRRELAERGLIE